MKIRQKSQVPLGWNDIDTVDQRFRFVLRERASGDRTYEWILSGTYFVDDGQVGIASLNLRQHIRPDNRVPRPQNNGSLDRERIRRLTSVAPLKRRIAKAIEEDRSTGHRIFTHLEQQQIHGNVTITDEDWAEMASSYLSEVAKRGTAYKVQSDLGNPDLPGNWGVGHEAVRTRVKRLRDDGWINGTGRFARPGDRLLTWTEEKETGNG